MENDNIKEAHAYWLSPKGKIIEIKTTHIDYVLKNPDEFKVYEDGKIVKLTDEMLRAKYKQYKEPYGWEGNARRDIIIDVMKTGWVRIRDYANRGWSVEVWELDKYAQEQIFDWATKVKKLITESKPTFYNFYDVKIHVIKLEQEGKPQSSWYIETTFDDIIKGKLFESRRIKKFEEFVNENLNESSLNKVVDYMSKFDCGTISAFRHELRSNDCTVEKELNRKENRARNRSLKLKLIAQGYKCIKCKGTYIENMGLKSEFESKEDTFFVIDFQKKNDLKERLTELGEEFGQDSIMFIPKCNMEDLKKGVGFGSVIGTTKCFDAEMIPYHKSLDNSKISFGDKKTFMTKIKNRPFSFIAESEEFSKNSYNLSTMGYSIVPLSKKHWTELIED